VNLDQLGRKGWISSHSWKKKKDWEGKGWISPSLFEAWALCGWAGNLGLYETCSL
jgi:hypothetical protein